MHSHFVGRHEVAQMFKKKKEYRSNFSEVDVAPVKNYKVNEVEK